MNPRSHEEPDDRCPHCGAWQTRGDRAAQCPFCDAERPRGNHPRGQHPVLKGLIRVAQAYRHWSLAVFIGAVIDLLRVGNSKSFFFGFVVLFPFGMALWLAYLTRNATPRWIIAFLVLVDIGVIFAPAHQIFPWLNFFPEISQTRNRILSWYILVYVTLQFGVAPPIAFVRSLRTAWHGGKPSLATWICVFGFAVWGLFVSVVTLGVITTWKQ